MIEKVRSMAMMLSLGRKRWLAGCGAYIGGLAGRQATAGTASQALPQGAASDFGLDDKNFTRMNPI
nr:hypothetical protein BDOA9_0140860 [Bradyrhizobium sp. DOA9]